MFYARSSNQIWLDLTLAAILPLTKLWETLKVTKLEKIIKEEIWWIERLPLKVPPANPRT